MVIGFPPPEAAPYPAYRPRVHPGSYIAGDRASPLHIVRLITLAPDPIVDAMCYM